MGVWYEGWGVSVLHVAEKINNSSTWRGITLSELAEYFNKTPSQIFRKIGKIRRFVIFEKGPKHFGGLSRPAGKYYTIGKGGRAFLEKHDLIDFLDDSKDDDGNYKNPLIATCKREVEKARGKDGYYNLEWQRVLV